MATQSAKDGQRKATTRSKAADKAPRTAPVADVDNEKFVRTTVVQLGDGKRAVPPPFSRRASVRQFKGWTYSAATINAQQVAATPFRLYIRDKPNVTKHFKCREVPENRRRYLTGHGERCSSVRTLQKLLEFGDDFVEVTEDFPALDILRRPNRWLGGFDSLTLTALYLELTGDAWTYIAKSRDGTPREAWILPSQWTTVVPDEQSFVRGYRYGQFQETGVDLTTDEVLHFKHPNPENPFYGKGKVEAVWQSVVQDEAADRMETALLENNGRPDYLMVMRSGGGTDAMDRFEAKVEQKLRGESKRGRFLTVTGDVKLIPLMFGRNDLGDSDRVVTKIASAFKTPISMLLGNDANLASATAGYAQWREQGVLPVCRLLEDGYNQQLLPMFRTKSGRTLADDAVLAFDDPVPRNRQLDLQESDSYVKTARITVNEWRVANGYDKSDDPAADQLLFMNAPLGAGAMMPHGPFGAAGEDESRPGQDEERKPRGDAQIDGKTEKLIKRFVSDHNKQHGEDAGLTYDEAVAELRWRGIV